MKQVNGGEHIQNGNTRWINGLFRLMWLMVFSLFIAIPYEIEGVQRLSYWASSILNLVCFVFIVVNKQKEERDGGSKDPHFLLLAMVIFATCVALTFGGTFSFSQDNIMGYVNFASILIAMYSARYINISRKELKFIGIVNIFIAILFVYLSRMDFAYGRNEKWVESLTLGFSNPNAVGMIIFVNTVFLLITRELFKKGTMKTLITVLIAYDIYMIYLTRSRTALATAILVLMVYFLKTGKFKKNRIFVVLCVLFPLFFVFGYTYLYENNYFMDLEILGKTIYSGREVYYSDILSQVKNKQLGLVFGFFTEFQNTHNSALSLIRFFGLSGMITYYIYVLSNISGLTKRVFDNKISYICYMAILILYVQSCSESTIILGGGTWIIFMLSLYAIAGNYKEEEELSEDSKA